jgi:hypothetical protein
VTARSYTEAGLPWFDLLDEKKGALPPSGKLAGVKSVKEMDAKKGFSSQQDDETVQVDKGQVNVLSPNPEEIVDGIW